MVKANCSRASVSAIEAPWLTASSYCTRAPAHEIRAAVAAMSLRPLRLSPPSGKRPDEVCPRVGLGAWIVRRVRRHENLRLRRACAAAHARPGGGAGFDAGFGFGRVAGARALADGARPPVQALLAARLAAPCGGGQRVDRACHGARAGGGSRRAMARTPGGAVARGGLHGGRSIASEVRPSLAIASTVVRLRPCRWRAPAPARRRPRRHQRLDLGGQRARPADRLPRPARASGRHRARPSPARPAPSGRRRRRRPSRPDRAAH